MSLNRRELLERISEYQFACIELNLYLDNNQGIRKLLIHTTDTAINLHKLCVIMNLDMEH